MLRQIGNQPGGGIDARGGVHDHVAEVADQQVKQLGELRGRRLRLHRRGGAGQQLQASAVAGHETFQQGTVQAMQVADGISHGEQRFQVQVQRAVSEWGNVNQGGAAVGSLQGQSKIDGYRGGAAAPFGVDHGEHLAARFFAAALSLRGGQPHKGFQQIGGGGGPLHEFASSGPHRIHDDLGLGQTCRWQTEPSPAPHCEAVQWHAKQGWRCRRGYPPG